MKYAACVFALGLVFQAAPAAGQVVYEPVPEVTYYAPSPVVTYYAPSVPVTTYYASPRATTYYRAPYYRAYVPAVAVYPARSYYVPRRVARRMYRNGF
jgi:hypothetical protein